MSSLAMVRDPKRDYTAPSNKHDTGYKYLLANKATFLQFLRTFIEADWVDDVTEGRISRVPKSFILQDFSQREADLVYKIRLADKDIVFYILMELQSTVDTAMPFRLLMYMVEIWRDYVLNESQHLPGGKFKLPVIVPCVLYNGRNRWTVPTSFGKGQVGFEYFPDYALDFEYILIDVNRYDKSKLLASSNLMGSVFYIDQLRGIDEILRGLNEVAAVTADMPEDELLRFSTWAGKVVIKGMSQEDKDKVLQHLHKKGGKSLITNFERILQETLQKYRVEGLAEGRAEGRAEGFIEGKRLIAKNFLKLGLAPKQVAVASELSLKEVMKLQAELNN